MKKKTKKRLPSKDWIKLQVRDTLWTLFEGGYLSCGKQRMIANVELAMTDLIRKILKKLDES